MSDNPQQPQQPIGPNTIMQSVQPTPDKRAKQYFAEGVFGGLYVSAAHMVPDYLAEQVNSGVDVAEITWERLRGEVEAGAAAGEGVPAIKVIAEQRMMIQQARTVAESLQGEVQRLTNALEASDQRSHQQQGEIEALWQTLHHYANKAKGIDPETIKDGLAIVARMLEEIRQDEAEIEEMPTPIEEPVAPEEPAKH